MKWGVYARDGFPVARCFGDGLREIGERPIYRSLTDWKDDCKEKFDAVVIFGLRGKGRQILQAYGSAWVVDYGYLKRVHGEQDFLTGYWQVSLGGLNRPPTFDCPDDRFKALGLKLGREKKEGHRVLCTQLPGDAAHGFETQEQIDAWAATVPHDELRGHPVAGEVEPLADMLKRAGSVVTWNSNVGHDALLAGVPVECHGDAPYKGVRMEDRRVYFSRLAYGQWTADEMRQGLPQRFILERYRGA